MKLNFSKKDIIKFVLFVYLPLLTIPLINNYYATGKELKFDGSFYDLIMIFLFPFWFSYPVYLLVNFKFNKLFEWILIGYIPFTIYIYIYILKKELINSLFLGAISANLMYPLGLLAIKTTKEYWEMSKEMTLGRKIGLLLSLIFILISILKRARW